MDSASSLPNPTTPLAFLPPVLASQLELSRYVFVAVLSVCSTPLHRYTDEYRMLRTSRIRLPIFVYFISRFASLAFILTSTMFGVSPLESCQGIALAVGCSFSVAVPATSALFLLRIRAVFSNNLYITVFFGAMWLATLGGSIAVPFAISGGHIGPTRYCMNTGVKPVSSAGIISNAFSNTLSFLFISFRLASSSFDTPGVKHLLRSAVSGRGLHGVSRSLLQSGQIYYLATVGLNIATMVMLLSPSVNPLTKAMFPIPNVAIESAMACRVFRAVRLGLIEGSKTSTQSSYNQNVNNSSGPRMNVLHSPLRRPKPTYSGPHYPLDSPQFQGDPVGIELEEVVHITNDDVESSQRRWRGQATAKYDGEV